MLYSLQQPKANLKYAKLKAENFQPVSVQSNIPWQSVAGPASFAGLVPQVGPSAALLAGPVMSRRPGWSCVSLWSSQTHRGLEGRQLGIRKLANAPPNPSPENLRVNFLQFCICLGGANFFFFSRQYCYFSNGA